MIYTFHFLVSYLRKNLSELMCKEIYGNMFTATLCKTEKKKGSCFAYQSDKRKISNIILIML